MAFKLHQADDDHDSHSDSAKPIHFFKIILTQSLREGKLRIPGKFVKKYGEGLSDSVFLRLPSGEEWKVDLEKRDGEVWFQKGWKEFAESHCLDHGHLLVFRYEKTSHFHVLIFDKSASEIDYHSSKNIGGKEACRDEQEFQLSDVEILEERRPKREENSSIQLQQRKMRRTNGGEKVKSTTNLQEEALHHTSRECKGKLNQPTETQEERTLDLITEKPSSVPNFGAYEDAGRFSSEHSFFKVTMHLSYITKTPRLPIEFLKGKIKSGEQVAKVQVGERWWRIKLMYYPKYSSAFFSAGWMAFARENALKVKDVCFFELLNSDHDDIVMKVSIFRHSSV